MKDNKFIFRMFVITAFIWMFTSCMIKIKPKDGHINREVSMIVNDSTEIPQSYLTSVTFTSLMVRSRGDIVEYCKTYSGGNLHIRLEDAKNGLTYEMTIKDCDKIPSHDVCFDSVGERYCFIEYEQRGKNANK